MDTIYKLDASGHLTFSWDPSDPADVAKAREHVALLKAQGYTFYAVVGTEGDEVTAGNGRLLLENPPTIQRIPDPIRPPPPAPTVAAPEDPPRRKQGRPRKDAAPPPPPPDRKVVAMRPQQGG